MPDPELKYVYLAIKCGPLSNIEDLAEVNQQKLQRTKSVFFKKLSAIILSSLETKAEEVIRGATQHWEKA